MSLPMNGAHVSERARIRLRFGSPANSRPFRDVRSEVMLLSFGVMSSLTSFPKAGTIQLNRPLTLTLSPSDGEREAMRTLSESSLSGEGARARVAFALSPSDGERVGVRG